MRDGHDPVPWLAEVLAPGGGALPTACTGLTLEGLLSAVPPPPVVLLLLLLLQSELRVARGLATGAVERLDASPVQRRVNCSVGPWEKVRSGSHCGRDGERGEALARPTWVPENTVTRVSFSTAFS